MSLADRIDQSKRRIGSGRLALILWLSALALIGGVLLLVILQRLGLSVQTANAGAAAWIVCSILIASWLGRTINAPLFFFADRKANAASLGIGGLSTWCCGAFLLLYFAGDPSESGLLTTAAFAGIALHGALFAGPMRASQTASLPGALSWRYGNLLPAVVVLPTCLAVMGIMIVCEHAIAARFFALFSGIEIKNAGLTIALLAVAPALLGGWMSLFIVNAVLGLWVLIALLAPAVFVGFLPSVLSVSTPPGQVMPLLVLQGSELAFPEMWGNPWMMICLLFVLATGLASLPQAMSRSGLAVRRSAAIEATAWSALSLFLMVNAFGLSIGLIIAGTSETKQTAFLQSQIALNTMPYAAFLLISFNALSISLWVAALTLVRTLRRGRVAEPGGGSMFAIRSLLIATAFFLGLRLDPSIVDTSFLYLLAIALASSGLFVPVLCAFWIGRMPQVALVAAAIFGPLVLVGLLFYDDLSGSSLAIPPEFTSHPLTAGATGLSISALCCLAGWCTQKLRRRRPNPGFARLNNPE